MAGAGLGVDSMPPGNNDGVVIRRIEMTEQRPELVLSVNRAVGSSAANVLSTGP
jgi:hypothetical protein